MQASKPYVKVILKCSVFRIWALYFYLKIFQAFYRLYTTQPYNSFPVFFYFANPPLPHPCYRSRYQLTEKLPKITKQFNSNFRTITHIWPPALSFHWKKYPFLRLTPVGMFCRLSFWGTKHCHFFLCSKPDGLSEGTLILQTKVPWAVTPY